jgi:hypothetical protein
MNRFEFEKMEKQFLKDFGNMGLSPFSILTKPFNRIKRFYFKNIRIIYGVIITTILISIIGYIIFKEPKGLYEITTNYGKTYTTNNVEIKDGCVYFTRNKNKKETILCGEFKIEKNNN